MIKTDITVFAVLIFIKCDAIRIASHTDTMMCRVWIRSAVVSNVETFFVNSAHYNFVEFFQNSILELRISPVKTLNANYMWIFRVLLRVQLDLKTLKKLKINLNAILTNVIVSRRHVYCVNLFCENHNRPFQQKRFSQKGVRKRKKS